MPRGLLLGAAEHDLVPARDGRAAALAGRLAGGGLVDVRACPNIGDAGAAAIGEALKFNAVLTKLDIGYNRIGDEGAAAIGEGLKCNAVLKELRLFNNQIGNTGAAALADSLKVNAVLKKKSGACDLRLLM